MRRNHKLIAALGVCLALTLSVTACSQSGGSASGKAAGSGGTSGKAEPNVTLTFWNVPDCFHDTDTTGKIPKNQLIVNVMLKAFEKEHPNIKVNVVDQTYDNISKLFKVAGLAKNGPDVALMWAGSDTVDFSDFILPLDSYFTSGELSKFPDLTLCRKDFKKDGALLGIPTESTTLNVFYNKALFKKAGIDENAKPATWDDFIAICKKLKAAGILPLEVGEKEGYNSAWIMGNFLSNQYGTQGIFDFYDGTAKPTDAKFTSAMQVWSNFFRLGYVNKDYISLSNGDALNNFFAGKCAMKISGSWDTLNVTNALGANAGTFPIPDMDSKVPYPGYLCSQYSNNLLVTNYSKNKDAAVTFIKHFTSADFQKARYLQDGQLPSRLDVNISSDQKNPLGVESYEWTTKSKNVVGFDSIMASDACSEFYRLAPEVIGQQMSVSAMAADVQAKNAAALKK